MKDGVVTQPDNVCDGHSRLQRRDIDNSRNEWSTNEADDVVNQPNFSEQLLVRADEGQDIKSVVARQNIGILVQSLTALRPHPYSLSHHVLARW